ncbi:TIM barrel protein [Ferrimonas kyonanensis]|uniref:TIM barrel protein n=1 Tax=Ferrimonas kyonanensis TaxID=364763 RepID=UPI00040A918A|nr:TIM barrel protein [Ferrimonas kyonanensis]
MKQLLNVTVNPAPGHLLQDWSHARQWLQAAGLDGYEIAPHGQFEASQVPMDLVGGLHLTFFPILTPFWQQNTTALLAMFDDWQTVEHFYGSRDPEHLVAIYVHQLNLAADLGAPYVVFHPVTCDMDNLFSQQFPWHWRDTLKVCAELINAALAQSHFSGRLLFENLWWPGSFRLDSREEYDTLRQWVNYDNCGLCFDAGHMMATHTGLRSEQEGVAFLQQRLKSLDLTDEIHTLHLNCSLNGAYIEAAKTQTDPYQGCPDFWYRLERALKHVTQIDGHHPFTETDLRPLLAAIEPEHLVHELAQDSLEQWQRACEQQQALVISC